MSASKVAAHTGFNFITIACNAASSLVLTAVVARWLGPSGMGSYSLVTWFFAMAGILVNLGLVTTTMKYMAEALGRQDDAEAAAILAYGMRRLLINGFVITALWLLAMPWAAAAYHQPSLVALMPFAALAIIPTSAMALCMAATQGLQRYGRVAMATATYAGILLFGSLSTLELGYGIGGLLAVSAVAASVACLIYLTALSTWTPRWWRFKITSERRQLLRGYGASLMVLILLDAIVWQRSAVFFLGLWRPAQEVAFFAMAFGLATMAMKLIPGTLVGLLIPSMARSFGNGRLDHIASIYHLAGRWMAVLALPVAAGGAALSLPLVTSLYGPTYAPMAPILSILLASAALVNVFGFPASSVLYAVDGQRHMVKIGMVAAVANIALMALLVPTYGVLGATVATAFSQLLVLPPGAYYAGKLLGGIGPAWRRMPAIALASLAMAAPVAFVAAHFAPHTALAIGIPLGALLYPPLLALCRGLESEDWSRILEVASKLPLLKRWVTARV
jgi:O-antigen/teichoic acid export membrane protein